jgi:hypothetical protein
LKLFVGSPLTEVSERPTASAHLISNLFREQGACRCSYLVRMIKPKPDHISRLACSTNLSKILEDVPPERDPFGSRPGLLRQGVLELVALADFASYRSSQRFCANLLNLSKFAPCVNAFFQATQISKLLVQKRRTAQNFK